MVSRKVSLLVLMVAIRPILAELGAEVPNAAQADGNA